ncbi:hypothetical protein WN55_01053 [Dufourea novaeangliae]|uniref:Uncharacterized protein n=1 Tax=Dufourea novaeangliae TaxID=178035 RepID=A0A154PFT7_DUFNO|nr:hypothetical protein WN55_01053 [Dufourea novaeangliae]
MSMGSNRRPIFARREQDTADGGASSALRVSQASVDGAGDRWICYANSICEEHAPKRCA